MSALDAAAAADLVGRIADGDQRAEADLVERCGGALRFLARRFTRDEADAEEVFERRKEHDFSRNAIAASPKLTRVLNQMADGVFSPQDRDRYTGLVRLLHEHDYFLVTCDFDDYFATQRKVDAAFADRDGWTRMAALNTAQQRAKKSPSRALPP